MQKIGLVLAGGMAKGAFQIGLLKALNEYFTPEDFQIISCSSIGVLNGYAFATNQIDEGIEMWKNIIPDNKRVYVTKMFKSPALQDCIAQLYENNSNVKTHLYGTLYNASKQTLNYTNFQEIPDSLKQQYLRASVAFPIFNSPIIINEEKFYDGAPIDNIPIYPLIDKDLDYIICIYFDQCNYTFENKEFDEKVLKIVYKDDKMIKGSICFERDKISEMIDEGYNQTKEIFEEIFKNGRDNLDSIKQYIKEFNKTHEPNFRLTGELVTSNCNKISKKLIRNTIVK